MTYASHTFSRTNFFMSGDKNEGGLLAQLLRSELDVGLIAHNETEEIKKSFVYQKVVMCEFVAVGFCIIKDKTEDLFYFASQHRTQKLPRGDFLFAALCWCFEREFMSTLNALDLKEEKPGVMALLKLFHIISVNFHFCKHTGAKKITIIALLFLVAPVPCCTDKKLA